MKADYFLVIPIPLPICMTVLFICLDQDSELSIVTARSFIVFTCSIFVVPIANFS